MVGLEDRVQSLVVGDQGHSEDAGRVAPERVGAAAVDALELRSVDLVVPHEITVRGDQPILVVAGLLGSILGLAAGASFAELPFFLKTQPSHPEYDLLISMIMHTSIWGLTGAAAGLAFAVGLGERRLLGRALAAGFVGAVFGAIAFELIGAGLFPFASTGQPISTTWQTRLMARLMVTVATAAVIILLLPGSRPDKAPRRAVLAPPAVS